MRHPPAKAGAKLLGVLALLAAGGLAGLVLYATLELRKALL